MSDDPEPRRPAASTRGSRALTPDGLRAAIDELVDQLVGRGVPATLTIYGGAAMALVHYERAATGDVDASFFPPDEVLVAALAVGGRRRLAGDWLNNAATQFLPPVPAESQVIIERGDVTVSVGRRSAGGVRFEHEPRRGEGLEFSAGSFPRRFRTMAR